MQLIEETKKSVHHRRLADYLWCLLLIFLVNIAVFYSGLYSYVCRPDSYAGNIYGRLSILHQLESQSREKPVIVMGDSTIEDGIAATQLSEATGKPVANMAMPATGPLVWLHYFRSIDPDRDRFQTVILMITPQDVRTTPHDEGIQSLLAVASPRILWNYLSRYEDPSDHFSDWYASIDRLYAFRRDLRDLLINPDRLFHASAKRKENLERLKQGHSDQSDVCGLLLNRSKQKVLRWGPVRDRELRQVINKTLTRTHRLNESPTVTGMLEPVEEIVRYYRDSGTQIFIVSFPFGWNHHVDPQDPVIRGYAGRLKKLDALPSVGFWDATSLLLFQDCANFYDFRHLNVRGRKLFTAEFARELQHAF